MALLFCSYETQKKYQLSVKDNNKCIFVLLEKLIHDVSFLSSIVFLFH